MSSKYVGRKESLEDLKALQAKKKASLVVINGRRRVGKSRLAEEFGKSQVFIPFTGLPPLEGITAQDQRNNFAEQLSAHFRLPNFTFLDWGEAFKALGSLLSQSPTVVLFDEISWLSHEDPLFLAKFKVWWDLNHSKFPHLIFILCGSVSSWIEENILKSTAFFGRISLTIHLQPLSTRESVQLLQANGIQGSAYDYYKILSITGGIPWYLEQILPSKLADNNISDLCFARNGLLVTEFDKIFHDLFGSQGTTYKKILSILERGMYTQAEIREEMNYAHSGTFSALMEHLCIAGFVTEHFQWQLKTGKAARQSLYRLSDPYIRFYLKYIEPNLEKIKAGLFEAVELVKLPGWDSMMGFQVENLLLQNRKLLLDSLGISGNDLLADNPFLQRTTSRRQGCQIDYLVQTKNWNLFVSEFKFNRKMIGREIINEMAEKLQRFTVPKGFAKIPVLFHLGEVSSSVYDANFFYKIIDIGDYL
ncbi:MAG: ATPase [Verrucomicrobia bacterium]|nr:ATPase [Verrucomicrobiota bacterium]